jgi:hypothetical protein
MTRISTIQGVRGSIPANEMAQRSQLVRSSYLPYLSLTQGEMMLANYMDKARMYAAYYADPTYQNAATMLENALYAGVHNGIHFVGAIPDALQPIAAAIVAAKGMNRPASGDILLERPEIDRPKGFLSGVHIANIVPNDPNLDDCHKYALSYVQKYYKTLTVAEIAARVALPLLNQDIIKKYKEGKEVCKRKKEVEKLLNQSITEFGHHTLYGFLPNLGNDFPNVISTKRILQASGHEDLARVANATEGNMKIWLDTAIMRRNAQSSLEPYNQWETNQYWAGLPKEAVAEFNEFVKAKSKSDKFKLTDDVVAQKYKELLDKYGQPNLGIDPATIITIGKVLVAVLTTLPAIITALKGQQSDALSASRGIGTGAYGPEIPDWKGGTGGGGSGSSNSSTLPLLAVGVVGAYFLLK